jgi:ABC-type nickel/cobalt efflux system permease component RcnA
MPRLLFTLTGDTRPCYDFEIRATAGSAAEVSDRIRKSLIYPMTSLPNLFAVVGLGFLLGMRHATDPDHVVAVTTIVSRQSSIRHAGLIGAFWGLGHTLTILVVGAGIIVFNLAIPIKVGLAMELAVGLMLILLGVLNLAGITQRITDKFMPAHAHAEVVHSHPHQHGAHLHEHVHAHAPEVHMHLDESPKGRLSQTLQKIGLYQMLRPLAVGIVHGLAGSAAVALLVLATIRDPRWAVIYLLVFGVGTIAGMIVITMAIGAPFAYTGKKFTSFNRGLAIVSGVVSVVFGAFISFQIGFVDGLFTSHPHWTPH